MKATSFLEEIGRAGGANELPSILKKWIDSEKLPLKNSCDQVENLWVKIRDWTDKRHLVFELYYRPPDQGEPIDEAIFHQPQEKLCLGIKE